MNCTCMIIFHSNVQVERENRQNAGRRARTLLRLIDEAAGSFLALVGSVEACDGTAQDGDGELDFDELDAALKQKADSC